MLILVIFVNFLASWHIDIKLVSELLNQFFDYMLLISRKSLLRIDGQGGIIVVNFAKTEDILLGRVHLLTKEERLFLMLKRLLSIPYYFLFPHLLYK